MWLANIGAEPETVMPTGVAAPARAAFLALESFDEAEAQPDHLDRMAAPVAPGSGIVLDAYAVCRLVYS